MVEGGFGEIAADAAGAALTRASVTGEVACSSELVY